MTRAVGGYVPPCLIVVRPAPTTHRKMLNAPSVYGGALSAPSARSAQSHALASGCYGGIVAIYTIRAFGAGFGDPAVLLRAATALRLGQSRWTAPKSGHKRRGYRANRLMPVGRQVPCLTGRIEGGASFGQ
jgi:hypothetical protein